MRVTVPSSYMVWPRGMGGLGQTNTSIDTSSGSSGDLLSSLPLESTGTLTSSDLSTSELDTIGSEQAAYTEGSLMAPTTTLNQYITNTTAAPTTPGAAGASTANLLTAAGIAAAAAAKGITAASGPWQVPGTSLVYNPATGQIINAYGQTVGTYGMAGAAVDIGSFLPLIIGGVVIFVLIGSTRGK